MADTPDRSIYTHETHTRTAAYIPSVHSVTNRHKIHLFSLGLIVDSCEKWGGGGICQGCILKRCQLRSCLCYLPNKVKTCRTRCAVWQGAHDVPDYKSVIDETNPYYTGTVQIGISRGECKSRGVQVRRRPLLTEPVVQPFLLYFQGSRYWATWVFPFRLTGMAWSMSSSQNQ